MISRRSCGHVSRRITLAHRPCAALLVGGAALLVGCGFQSRSSASPPDASADSLPDGFVPETICASVSAGSPTFTIPQTCVPTTASSIDITTDTTIDTTAGTSGLHCTQVSNSDPPYNACVLSAAAIHVAPGARLSARGTRALALFAHTITIAGTVDVASHLNATPGAGARVNGCTAGVLAKGAGGGRGGAAAGPGGEGGAEGLTAGTGAHGGATFSIVSLAGGCGGTRGGDGTVPPDLSDGGQATGGAGGGAVWIYADRDPLVIAAGAVINASGAPGVGGTSPGHGGAGGGAGGLIVLHAASIQLDPTAMIFANGGPGGGGAGINNAGVGYQGGTPGTDPDGPKSGGTAGQGGTDGDTSGPPGPDAGDGGLGFFLDAPAGATAGHAGGSVSGRGGGGGGGGAGAIRVISTNNLASTNLSPPPLLLLPPASPAP